MKPAVVFDLDGTLVDSAAAIRDIANIQMAELGLDQLTLAEARSYIGNGAPTFLERALKARNVYSQEQFKERLHRFEELYAQAPGEANIPFPGVGAAMRALVEAGHRIALCTNKPLAPTLVLLDAHGWRELFTAIVSGDTLPERKPHPAPLIEAARRSGAGPVVYVGDSEVDVATADAAGVQLLLYAGGYRKTPLTELKHAAAFEDFAEVPALVARHAREIAVTA
ncbi:MAG: phosphoglycolate phosphatase [Hyphomicrobiaceae bacterium]|nr:phosphoglycolate phosphatase [Hyphomicrobiaceae bacterium]